MYDKNVVQSKKRLEVLSEIEPFFEKGIRLSIDEYSYLPDEIADIISVNEDEHYMPDYLQNDSGELIEIRYNKVKHD